MDTQLTRELDLRGTDRARLQFDLRFDTEEAYDYAHVLVSTDGGARWQPLSGRYATTTNPTGRNLVGVGYNGRSGGASSAEWVQEEIDLSPFAGQRVLIRFEYVTDDAYNVEGMAIANATVPEIGWRDDGSGWTAAGFVWADNAMPQPFAVQVVEERGDAKVVRQVPVGPDGRGMLDLPTLGGEVSGAVIAVSGLAPQTLQPARYVLTVEPRGP
jgi:hypothetical protein